MSTCGWCGAEIDAEFGSCRLCPPARDSLDEMFMANAGLARKAAWRFAGACRLVGLDLEDGLQEAYAGLWFACRRYDPSRGFKLSTYAMRCAWGFVLNGFKRYERGIRNAKRTGRDRLRFQQLVAEEGEPDPMQQVAIDHADDVVSEAMRSEEAALVASCLAGMHPTDAQILRRRLMDEHPQHDIAASLGVSKQAVGQRQKRAERRLEKLLWERGVVA